MKKLSYSITLFLWAAASAFAQENTEEPLNYIGVNAAHTAVLALLSSGIDPSILYLPVQVSYAHAFSEHWGLSILALYRYELDDVYRTHEVGIAVGPRWSSHYLNGFFLEIKAGAAVAFGRDYFERDYVRIDLVIEPAFGFTFVIGRNFSLTVGGGLQTLVCLGENPVRSQPYGMYNWDWSGLGELSHYYLPVANVSAAILF
jgi:hypothetical protein